MDAAPRGASSGHRDWKSANYSLRPVYFAHGRRIDEGSASLVCEIRAGPSLAADPRSLRALDSGGYGAADSGRDGPALLRTIHKALSGCALAGGGLRGRGAAALGRAWLLLPGSSPASSRDSGGGAIWWADSRKSGPLAGVARRWTIYRGGRRGDRLRPGYPGTGWQPAAGAGPPVRYRSPPPPPPPGGGG